MHKNIISAWLILDNKYVVLQRRSVENKSFHYLCQPTWSGKGEEGETPEESLKRECQEEVGQELYDSVDFSKMDLFSEYTIQKENEEITSFNYKLNIDRALLEKAQLNSEALPEFVLLEKGQEVYPLSSGKDPKDHIVLFDDQYKILIELLNNGN